jgi:hypothetical protein
MNRGKMASLRMIIAIAMYGTASLYIKGTPALLYIEDSSSRQQPKISSIVTENLSIEARSIACPQDEPPLQFNLESDIDYTKKPACGKHKCFFKSKDSPGKIGYLITDGRYFDKLKESWETACGMGEHKHIYTAKPPILLQLILGHTPQFFLQDVRISDEEDKVQIFLNSTQLAVLQVRVADKFVEVDCKYPRRPFFEELYESLDNNPRAIERYVKEVDKVADLLRDIPGLVSDFQMMVHRDGTIRHYDLDRLLSRDVKRNAIAACVCNLKMDAVLLTQHSDFLRKAFKGTRGYFHFYEERPQLFEGIPECANTSLEAPSS